MALTSKKIKRARIVHGLTQKQFAEQVNRTERTVARWENGKLSEDAKKYLAVWFKAHSWDVS